MDIFNNLLDLITGFLRSLLGIVEAFLTLIINFLRGLLGLFS